MSKISPFLWFNDQAEEAAEFYVAAIPDSRIDHRSRQGEAIVTISFTLAGQHFIALNGGPQFSFTPAISLLVDCADQAEVDRLWDTLSEGGSTSQCGWLTDRYGLSWQIVPAAFGRMLTEGDSAQSQRVFQAMMGMTKFDIAALQRAYAAAA